MSSRQIMVPHKLYKESWEFKRLYMRQNGENIPLYKALAEVQRLKQKPGDKNDRGGFIL